MRGERPADRPAAFFANRRPPRFLRVVAKRSVRSLASIFARLVPPLGNNHFLLCWMFLSTANPEAAMNLLCLSKCHIVVNLVILILALLADFLSARINTLRLHGLEEICAFYCLLMGVVGIFGSASHRRSLIIAYMILGFHAIFIFMPVIIIVSSFDIHFYKRECWGQCDWHLLSASLPQNSQCQILCGQHIDENKRSTMSRLGTDYRLDAGIISLAILELLLSVLTTVLCIKEVFGLSLQDEANTANVPLELAPLQHEKSDGNLNGSPPSTPRRLSGSSVAFRCGALQPLTFDLRFFSSVLSATYCSQFNAYS
ncbi:hypothetical protein M3Y99_00074000 [Aphelenchoides fujianensis]|nr:hypothetical protein M3Y99_00074000 [Aphelenchoides fujianensis]